MFNDIPEDTDMRPLERCMGEEIFATHPRYFHLILGLQQDSKKNPYCLDNQTFYDKVLPTFFRQRQEPQQNAPGKREWPKVRELADHAAHEACHLGFIMWVADEKDKKISKDNWSQTYFKVVPDDTESDEFGTLWKNRLADKLKKAWKDWKEKLPPTVVTTASGESFSSDEPTASSSKKTKLTPQGIPPRLFPGEPIGRENEIEQVKKQLREGCTLGAITGLVGVGKTHLAMYCVWDWLREDGPEHCKRRVVYWLSPGKNELQSESSIRHGYQDILKDLGALPDDPSDKFPTPDYAKKVFQELQNRNDIEWLVVFDDIPEAYENSEGFDVFKPWFVSEHEKIGQGRVLFTCRSTTYIESRSWGRIRNILVRPLEMAPAVNLLCQCAHLEPDKYRDAAGKLVGESYFDGLPLVITVAGTLIAQKKISIQAYIDEIDKKKADEPSVLGTDSEKSISITLKAAYDFACTNDDHAKAVVEIASYVNPYDIPGALFGTTYTQGCNVLKKLNLLQGDGEDSFAMHGMIQEAFRKESGPAAASTALLQQFENLDQKEIRVNVSSKEADRLQPHLSHLIELVSAGRTHSQQTENVIVIRHLIKLLLISGNAFKNSGKFAGATKRYEMLERLFYILPFDGEQEQQFQLLLAPAYEGLQEIYLLQGLEDRAREYAEKLATIFRTNMGNNAHYEGVQQLNTELLNRTLHPGRFRSFLQETIDNFGETNDLTELVNQASALSNLALEYVKEEKHDDALNYFHRALTLLKENVRCGKFHYPDKLETTLLLIGQTYWSRRSVGDCHRAKNYLVEAGQLHKEDIFTTNRMRIFKMLSLVYMELGENQAAVDAAKRSLEILHKSIENRNALKHDEFCFSIFQLANVHLRCGKPTEAERLAETCLEAVNAQHGSPLPGQTRCILLRDVSALLKEAQKQVLERGRFHGGDFVVVKHGNMRKLGQVTGRKRERYIVKVRDGKRDSPSEEVLRLTEAEMEEKLPNEAVVEFVGLRNCKHLNGLQCTITGVDKLVGRYTVKHEIERNGNEVSGRVLPENVRVVDVD